MPFKKKPPQVDPDASVTLDRLGSLKLEAEAASDTLGHELVWRDETGWSLGHCACGGTVGVAPHPPAGAPTIQHDAVLLKECPCS